jgi:hypothetical protein
MSPYDTAASPEEFVIALDWLSLLIDELVATEQLQFFRPASQRFQLQADQTAPYGLSALLSTDLGLITEVQLVSPAGRKRPVKMLRRDVYDLETYVEGQQGEPEVCFIENKPSPSMSLYPTITEDGWEIEVAGFRYAEDITVNNGQTSHGFPRGWQLAIIHLLASELGSGVITTLRLDERRQNQSTGDLKLRRLQARNNKEQVKRPRFTKAWGA